MRDLDLSKENKITLIDSRSGTSIELTYRMPTTQEEVDYQARAYRRKGKKMLVNTGMKITAALNIITGIRDGDFGLAGKPISSDLARENYYADWKTLLKESASDILIAFSAAVFEGTRVDNALGDELEYEAVEDTPPLPKNSAE